MKGQLKKMQKGFTLIELMIVVAVIGVLSAIAIPQYQTYVAKAELGAGFATVTSLRSNVEQYVVTNGAFPDGTTAEQTPADLGALNPANGVITFDNTTNRIKLAFNGTGNSPDVNSKAIVLERATTGAWTCKGDNAQKLLPKTCATATGL